MQEQCLTCSLDRIFNPKRNTGIVHEAGRVDDVFNLEINKFILIDFSILGR